MKKILIPSIAILVLLMISPAMAPATKTSVKGEFFGYAVDPGTQWISEEGIVQVRDGVGTGTVTGDIPGSMTFTMNAAFDPTTGKGRAWGKFVFTDEFGNTFEGAWLMSISSWGNYIEGKSEGQGTGAYEGMHLKNPFWGYNAYFGLPLAPYPKGTPIYFYFEGTIYSARAGFFMEFEEVYEGNILEIGNSVVQTTDGGYAIAGETLTFGADGFGYDAYLVKTDAVGTLQWNKTYELTGYDTFGMSLIQTADGGYAIAGATRDGNLIYDVYLVKTDATGTLQWNKTYGGTYGDFGYSVVQTADGGYAIAGYTYSFGVGNGDVYLVKTDATGTMQWNKTYGGTREDYGYCVVQTADGGYAIAGYSGFDAYLVKTDATGTMVWNKTYGGDAVDRAYSLVQTSDRGYAIAGEFTNIYFDGEFYYFNTDVYLVKTDATGTLQWNKTYGGTETDCGRSLVRTGDGGYAIAGWTQSFGAGSLDVYLVRTDSAGTMLWNRTFGGTGSDLGLSLITTSDGGYVIAGYTDSFGAEIYLPNIYLIKTADVSAR